MTMQSTAVRWGDGRRADSDFAREQILDAAWRCYQQHTVQKTRMEHIAREAKVSRTTIYRYFQSRDDVLTGVFLRALDGLIEFVRESVANTDCFAEFLVESLAAGVERVPHTPEFVALMQETSLVMSRLYISSVEVLMRVCQFYQTRFEAAKTAGELREGIEFDQAMDWIIHVVSCYVMAPSPLCMALGWREMFRRFLVPSLVRDEVIPQRKGD